MGRHPLSPVTGDDLLGVLGRHGPVRKTTRFHYRTWCPVCGHHTLLVVVGQHGPRPASCVTGCTPSEVINALRQESR